MRKINAYFGSKISANMVATEEGYLIAKNVPIARTGWYEYHASEIGLEGEEMVQVFRDPEEVFSKASMASYECKIVTNEHPPDLLTSDNSQRYSKGAVRNVRRSKEEDDLLLADLVIHEKGLIKEVQDGKREVSAGYTCVYVDNGDGTYSQTSIRGNHVAVVSAGRAGKRVCIKDSKSKDKEREVDKMNNTKKYSIPKKMQYKASEFLSAIGLKHLAMDAEPDEIAGVMNDVSEEYSEKKARDNEETKKEETTDESPEIAAINERLDKLTSIMEKVISKDNEENPEEAIDVALEEIESQDEDEAEVVEDEGLPDAETTDPSDRPVNPIPNSDKAWAHALRAIKPVIAAMDSKEDRKKATDSLLKEFNKFKKTPKNKSNGYQNIASAQQRQAKDSSPKNKQAPNFETMGDEIAKRFNANMKGDK